MAGHDANLLPWVLPWPLHSRRLADGSLPLGLPHRNVFLVYRLRCIDGFEIPTWAEDVKHLRLSSLNAGYNRTIREVEIFHDLVVGKVDSG